MTLQAHDGGTAECEATAELHEAVRRLQHLFIPLNFYVFSEVMRPAQWAKVSRTVQPLVVRSTASLVP